MSYLEKNSSSFTFTSLCSILMIEVENVGLVNENNVLIHQVSLKHLALSKYFNITIFSESPWLDP